METEVTLSVEHKQILPMQSGSPSLGPGIIRRRDQRDSSEKDFPTRYCITDPILPGRPVVK